MSEELKPCPFCGGQAELIETMGSQAAAFSPYFRVTCTDCGIHQDQWDERKLAISAWNTRADTTIRAENELMREALGRIDAFDTIPPMDFLTTAERLECSVGEIKDIARNALAQVAK